MRYSLFFLSLFFSLSIFSQQEDAWVYFKDKPNAQVFLDNPLQMLTQRALDRRASQNIALNATDVPLETSYVEQIKQSAGITIMAKSKWMNALHIRGTQSSIATLTANNFVDKVVYANRNLNASSTKVTLSPVEKKNVTAKVKIDYSYGNGANQIQMLNGQVLHQQNFTGEGKVIAVLDAGFPGVNTAQPFQNLINNNRILGGYDFVARSDNFYTGNNHGTLVLSTMGGYKENALIGTAPDASYYLFITEDVLNENPVEESYWVEAAEKADSLGVDIITSSLGYFSFDNPNYSHIYTDMNGSTNFISRGAEIAFSKGIIVVASAGNEGNTSEPHIGGPADAVSVITVGSVSASKIKANSSSVGPTSDNRIKPDVMAQGAPAAVSNTAGTITTSNGTSFSCPIMAGMIACLWQAHPSKTNQEIRQMILQSSDRYTTPDNNYGYGIPNFGSALGVQSFDDTAIFTVHPNPAKTTISFSYSDLSSPASVTIYSVLGQKVLEEKVTLQNQIVSLQALKSGLYFYSFDAEGLHKTGKIIKQ